MMVGYVNQGNCFPPHWNAIQFLFCKNIHQSFQNHLLVSSFSFLFIVTTSQEIWKLAVFEMIVYIFCVYI